MVRALAALGHHVDLLTYPQGAPFELTGARHLRSPRVPVGRVRPGPSLAKLLLDAPFTLEAGLRLLFGRYDVVHAVEEAAHLIAPLARALRVPLVADVDSSIPEQLRDSGFARRGPLLWAAEASERHALRHAAAVISVCSSLTEAVRARAPGARVFQIEDPPLVEPGGAASAPVEARELRGAFGLDARKVALYTGNFEPYQGVELLVDAAALEPGVQFLFVGGEPREVEALRARAAAGGGACVFAGKRPPSDLPRLLALCDLVVSPRARGTNTPFKVYTYLAAGRPLVATRIPTHTQLLDDGLALLVEPTPEGLATGVRQTLARPEEAALRARRGVELIEREYSTARFQEKVREAYAGLATGRRRGAPAPGP